MQGQIYHEAKQVFKVQGHPLAWAPSKAQGEVQAICSHGRMFFVKFAKTRYFNHNRLSVIEVCQAVG